MISSPSWHRIPALSLTELFLDVAQFFNMPAPEPSAPQNLRAGTVPRGAPPGQLVSVEISTALRAFSLGLAIAVCLPDRLDQFSGQLGTFLKPLPLLEGMFSLLQTEVAASLAARDHNNGPVSFGARDFTDIAKRLPSSEASRALARLLEQVSKFSGGELPLAMMARFLSADTESWTPEISPEYRAEHSEAYATCTSPVLQELEREVSLLNWERTLCTGRSSNSPTLIAAFLTSRGCQDRIRQAFEVLGDEILSTEQRIQAQVFEDPIFKDVMSDKEAEYKLKFRIYRLRYKDGLNRRAVAKAFFDEGMDLREIQFERLWIETTRLKSGTDVGWIETFYAEMATEAQATAMGVQGVVRPGPRQIIGSAWLNAVHSKLFETQGPSGSATTTPGNAQIPFWAPLLEAYTRDRQALEVDIKSTEQARVWELLLGGDYVQYLVWCVKQGQDDDGTNPSVLSKLLHQPELRRDMHPVFLSHAFALAVGGAVASGDLLLAKNLVASDDFANAKDPDKLKASLWIAVELLYKVPRNPKGRDAPKGPPELPPPLYIASVFEAFPDVLMGHPRRVPFVVYLSPQSTSPDEMTLGLIDSSRDWRFVVKQCQRFNIPDRIQPCLEAILAEEMAIDTMLMGSFLGPVVKLLKDPEFTVHVRREAITEAVEAAKAKVETKLDGTVLGRRAAMLLLEIQRNSVLAQYQNIEPAAELRWVNAIVQSALNDHDIHIIDQPLSISMRCDHYDPGSILPTYLTVEPYRAQIDEVKYKRLVAWAIAFGCDLRGGLGFHPERETTFAKWSDPNYEPPSFLVSPNAPASARDSRVEAVNRIYIEELKRGRIDPKLVGTGITNMVFRSTYNTHFGFYPSVDPMLELISSPLGKLLPTDGPAGDALADYRVLLEQVR